MIKGSVDSIETFGLVDGPGIRVVVFLNGCKLRCKFCHNPEMFKITELNTEPIEILDKVKRYKNYFSNDGGITFSGGDPLLQPDFLIETMNLLKEEKIHIALDTAGVGIGRYEEILNLTDLVILDIKHVEEDGYKEITGTTMDEYNKFLEILNSMNKKVWIRQVITPGVTDNLEYLTKLKKYLTTIRNIERIDFLPFHRMGREKYLSLGLVYPYEDKEDMDPERCKELYNEFMKLE